MISGWSYLLSHPMRSTPLPDLNEAAAEVWSEIKFLCQVNDVTLDVQYDTGSIGDQPILAYASRTMFLKDGVFVPPVHMIFDADTAKHAVISIRVNPNVPNGWYLDKGLCNVGFQYDLKTVLRHEILHGLGLSSSVTDVGMGYVLNNKCYPTLFDIHMVDAQGDAVSKECSFLADPGQPVFLGGQKLYNPDEYRHGSSYSHHEAPGLLHYAIPPMTCMYIDEPQLDMLGDLGIRCSLRSHASSGHRATVDFAVYICVFILLKCLFVSRT